MSENKNEAVFLIPGEKTIYAVPASVCEQYKLEGKSLEAAKIALCGDVVGQSYELMWNSRHEAYTLNRNTYTYDRAPQYD